MDFEIVESSNAAKNGRKRRCKYPWYSLEVGQSFYCSADYLGMQAQCSRMGKLLSRKFRAINHCSDVDGKLDCKVEVARIA